MSNYTPGPWKATFPVGNLPFVSNEGQVVCQKVFPSNNPVTAEANARLIAAAPELLEALKALIDGRPTEEPPAIATIAHRNWELFQQARAAIAKATS